MSVHHWLRLLASPMRTSAFANGQTWDLPVPAQGASTHARFSDPAGPPGLAILRLAMLPSAYETASAPGFINFVAQWLAYALPYRRFVDVLADGNARLGADVVRYSFIVSDFHRLLLAGLPAHFVSDMASHAVGSHRFNFSTVENLPPVRGKTEIAVPRARLSTPEGKTTEWHSAVLRRYQRRTRTAVALIASTYLAGTNTRRVRRALDNAVWRRGEQGHGEPGVAQVESDWDAWNARSLAQEPIVRLILGGTAVKVRLDRKATSISLLVVLGVHADGQKVLLAVKSMGGESAAAWRSVLDDLIRRGLRRPQLLIVDGRSGLDAVLAALWSDMPVQRCTVHKHRNLLAHAPQRLHEEITADYNDMI